MSFEKLWADWEVEREKITSGQQMACAVFFYHEGKNHGRESFQDIFTKFWRGPKIEFQVSLIEEFGERIRPQEIDGTRDG